MPAPLRSQRLLILTGLAVVVLLPGYGVAILLLVWVALRWLPRPSGSLLREFQDHVAPQLGGPARPLAHLPFVEHLQVQPLIDLLDSPDLEVRKAVLEAMARRRGRLWVEHIQRSLNDPKPEIYQLAVAKLAQIQEQYSGELVEARGLYEQRSDREAAYGLARAYHDYLESGLLEPALEPLYWEQLATLYQEVSDRDEHDQYACLQRGQVLLRLERPAQARNQYLTLLKRDPDCAEAQLGLIEVCFVERDWAGLREQLPALNRLAARLPGEVRAQVEWLCR